ncbi:MAG: hypothetical protein GYA62_00180 [Bacteroidales bacterium]|nr:hypothetical protein [Bacteroidales bacterium]
MKRLNIPLLLILFAALAMRFFRFFDIPYTLDELSALNRTFYASFSELIEKGVYNDGHPALIQVFLFYYTKWFGYNEWVVKLPFLLMGLASVYLVYRIGREWFSETAGIFASALMATLQFTVMYSQIARPYASGLFFVLGMVYFWTKWLKTVNPKWYICLGYVCFTTLSAYNHYFSLLQSTLIALAGLFFVAKERRVRYVIINAIAVILFLPHISVSLHQMSMGGLNWLSAPTYQFFPVFYFFIFHFSYVLLLAVIALIITGVILFIKLKPGDRKWKFRIWSLIMFLFPLLFGFYYSVWFKPILQFSVLIFSFPFFLLFVFSFWPKINEKRLAILTLLLMFISSYSLIVQRQYYTFFYNQSYDAISKHQIALLDSLKKPVRLLINGYEAFFLNYYSVKNHHPIPCDVYTYDGFNEVSWEHYISGLKTDYIAMAHLGVTQLDYLDIARKYFPYFVKKSCGFSYEWYVFSKIPNTLSFFKTQKEMKFNQSRNSLEKAINGFVFNKGDEWGPSLETSYAELNIGKHDIIHISARLDSVKSDGMLVCEIRDSNDSLVVWQGVSTSNILKKNGMVDVFLTLRLTDILYYKNNFKLKAYYWNQSKGSVWLKRLKIGIEAGNPYIYAMVNDF